MRRTQRFSVLLCLMSLTLGLLEGRDKRPNGKPGKFDYYVLTLSWSPQHCAFKGSAADPTQCAEGRRFGFVVHGLWPQYERGYPRDCAAPGVVSDPITQRMLPIMPSAQLIRHEWSAHGTCSGLSPSKYFNLTEQAFASIKIPDMYRQPLQNVTTSPQRLRASFVEANRHLEESSVRLACSGRFLNELRICLTKDLKARACGVDLRDSCSAPELIMQPVR
jgi:ribonuclease T2